MEKLNNILIVAITRMGDMLQASPTILGLKEENPDARITVLIEKNFASICEGIPGIDEIFSIDLAFVCKCLSEEKEGIVQAFSYVSDVVADLRSRNFDYCLNMSSSGYTALLLKMLDIKNSRGWISDEEGYRLISNPWAMLFAAFVFHSNRDYNSINLVDIFRCSAGVEAHPDTLVYKVDPRCESFAEELLAEHGLSQGGPVICVQAGASQEKRQWQPSNFSKVVEALIDQLDARIIFTGSKSETPIVERILAECSGRSVINIVGKTNLGQLSAVLKRADVLITGDTGPMHLAVAVGTPVVALFLASALCFETGPYSKGNIVLQPQIGCNPCNPNFPCARPDCHAQIPPELVVEVTKLRLEKSDEELERLAFENPLANPSNVAVYLSVFDQDNFLDFKRINGVSERNGYSEQYYRAARDAYRALWKEELEEIKPSFQAPPAGALKELAFLKTGFDGVSELALSGQALIDRLEMLIRDSKSPPHLLGDVNNEREAVDRNIEEVGLSFPLLGAVIRMFVMEKQNMRGDDPLVLVHEMRRLYQTLARRSEKLERYLAA